MVLHLQQMDELWLPPASLYYIVEILLRLLDEIVDALLVCEDAVLLCVLEHTQIGLARHEQPVVLHYVDQAEAQKVQGDVHEVGGTVGHQADDVGVGTNHLRVHVGRYVLLNLSHPLRLLHVESLALKNNSLWEAVSHELLEL